MSAGAEVLVTGAAGFIGRHTVAAFHRAGYRVTALDLRPAPHHLVHAGRWVRGDFAAPGLLDQITAGRYKTVIHHAGISDTRVPASPELDETNTHAPLRLADACRRGGARLIYASSHSVYGTLYDRAPIAEDADEDHGRCSGPLNPYAASKLALDRQMRDRYDTGLQWVGLRYTNVVGPDEDDKGPMASILSQLLHQAATAGRVRIFDDSLTAARDYIPVETVTATLLQLTHQAVPPATYNLGAGHPVSFAEVAQWCAHWHREQGSGALRVELVPNPVPAAYQYYTCADMRGLDKALHSRPTLSPLDIKIRAAELFETYRRAQREKP
ncbi:MAG: NAD-dependent epimerase/dehydratase family protein [Pseudonocardiaceae bacterium]